MGQGREDMATKQVKEAKKSKDKNLHGSAYFHYCPTDLLIVTSGNRSVSLFAFSCFIFMRQGQSLNLCYYNA